MPILLAALIGGLAQAMASFVGRALIALSIGYVTFTGVQIGINAIITGIQSDMANLGTDAVNFLAFLWVDKAFSMIFSAWTAALGLKLAGAATIKKMVVK
jgi:hypothetical protein